VLDHTEQNCRDRYCRLLAERLGDALVGVRMFGSAARGDMWPAHSPMHSDIDLPVITRGEVGAECGRQLSPQFVTQQRLAAPADARTGAFLEQVAAEGVDVWSSR
jgi:predicted nucleotidyltransferase